MSEHTRSHRRLFYSLGLSSLILVTLVALLPGLVFHGACGALRCIEDPIDLEVTITHGESERVFEVMPPAQQPVTQSSDMESTQDAQEVDTEQPHDMTSTPAWHEIASEAASQNVVDRFAREEIRKSLWSRTGSVMFKDTGEFDFHEPATVIADLEFRIPVGVLGIGITIGGCFIGIPLAGIPVEKRTVGPTLVYCTDNYE